MKVFITFVVLLATCRADNATLVEVQALIDRVLGSGRFAPALELIDPTADGFDAFEIDSREGAPVVLRGSSGVALASAFDWYLKYHTNCTIGWGRDGSGDSVASFPFDEPPSPAFERHERAAKWSYYQNVCTVGYSMIWWSWARWQREIDWMAMSGINLPLAFVGQEIVLDRVFREQFNVSSEGMDAFFSGPAFLPWNRMSNMRGWGGPLPRGWIEEQGVMQTKILRAMRALGMTPVLAGFSGRVPAALQAMYPDADIIRAADWNGFADEYGMDYMLAPTDPLFREIGAAVTSATVALFGDNGDGRPNVYNMDTYNEMTPPTSDPAFLANSSRAVFEAMVAGDAAGVWLMQGWLFLETDFWQPEQIAAYLSPDAVPDDRMIVLDLAAEDQPQWPRMRNAGATKPIIWCMLHNYGGRRDLYGNLSYISTQPVVDMATLGPGAMVGTGITPEAIEQNPIIYELMNEMTWRLGEKRTDIDEWVARRAARRYGGEDASARLAWSALGSSVYDDATTVRSLLEAKPAFTSAAPRAHAAAVAGAWAELAASELTPTGPYLYDLADVGRQALANAFDSAVSLFSDAFVRCVDWADTFSVKTGVDIVGDGTYYDAAPSPDCGLYYGLAACNASALEAACVASPGCAGFNTNGWLKRQADQFVATDKTDAYVRDRGAAGGEACLPSLAAIAAGLDGLLSDLDRLLAATPMFLLGEWLADAAQWAGDAEEAALYALNAKNQISLWGPNGEINDYASKQWAGMVGDYHRARWALFTDAALEAARANASFDSAQFDADVLALGQSWYLSNATYSATPSGDDAVAVGRELLQKYASADAGAGFEATVDTSVAGDLSAMPGLPVGTLAWLCELEPACAGFTDSGALASQVVTTQPQSGVTLYAKLA